MNQPSASESPVISPWDHGRLVRKIDPREARLSRGFLRSRPEKWLPGLAAHWLPLTHSLSLDLKVTEVRPLATIPSGLEFGFSGSVDSEPLAIMIDQAASRAVRDALLPGMGGAAGDVVLEYAARRLLSSLALSWTGPESSQVQYEPESDPRQIRPYAGIRISLSLNGAPATIYLALGKILVEKLDGLWRRQIQSTIKGGANGDEARIECAQLTVPPAMLSEYLRSGAIIDLETPISDSIVLRLGGRGWLSGRLCAVGDKLGVEVSAAPPISPGVPEGTTRLAIEFGSLGLSGAAMAELSQPGAVLETDIILSDRVNLIISGERVGGASLCVYEGRFAIVVD